NEPDRDWFAPPSGQPSQPPQPAHPEDAGEPPSARAPRHAQPGRPQPPQYGQPPQPRARGQRPQPVPMMPPRRSDDPHPDQQVWPPAPHPDPPGGETQPLPAVPSAGPVPRRSMGAHTLGNSFGAQGDSPRSPRESPPVQPPVPPPVQPPVPPPVQPPTSPSSELPAEPPASPPAEPPAAGPPAAAPTPPRRTRTLLLGVGALVAFLVGVGAPTVDAFIFYRSGQPSDIEHVVPKGGELAFEHVSWKAAIEPMEAPRTTAPDRQWLKIIITRKGVDATGIKLTGKPELELRDREDRSWQVEVAEDNVAIDDAVVGKPYTYEAVAVVPKAVAGQVELHLRPNTTYLSDTPTDQLLAVPTDPAEQEKRKHKDVLVFRR
ncbi:hypothetical protein ACTWPW_18305, partial [Nonomuraea sp. KM90]